MIVNNVSLSFPAKRAYAILLRMAVSGAAAAYDITVDALEDLRTAADEALDFLLCTEKRPDAMALCDLYQNESGDITLHLRLSGRQGAQSTCGELYVTQAILQTLMNEVTLFTDQDGGTGVRMTLRRVK